MKEIENLSDLKRIELSIMKRIHEFCVENSITYYLTYGTLIGAIRHSGFIPWDDDIDIFMPRCDYEKFCKLFPLKQEEFGLSLVNHTTKPFYGRPMSKVIDNSTVLFEPAYRHDDPLGVFVDIWVLDGAGSDFKKAKSKKRKISHLVSILTYCNTKISYCRSLPKKIVSFFLALWKPRPLIRRIIKLCKESDYSKSDYLLSSFDPKRCIYKKDWFGEPMLHKFDDCSFFVPSHSDEVLTELYGNWRRLPPKAEQIPHHVMNVYLKD